MRRALCAALFLSGAAALLFENLWFRGAHLAFGNGVWAQSLVLASFMAGLALGASLTARWAGREVRPLRWYVRLETAVAVLGLALVLVLPHLSSGLAPLLGPLAERPPLLNAARLGLAFLLLVAPTTAMGMTLPLVTRAVAREGTFGANLGALYGWNTLGAVAGALAVETVVVPRLGIRAGGLLAASLSLCAALVAWAAAGRLASAEAPAPDAEAGVGGPASVETRRLLAVAFVGGGLFLALEVIWFRFLAMYSEGTALSFAVLLAVVLLGIAGGGLAAGAWQRRGARTSGIGAILAASALAVIAQYAGFARLLPLLLDLGVPALERTLAAAAWLTLPSSFLSGLLFTLLGTAVEARVVSHQRSAGLLVFVNTTGALGGSVLGGFVLLPYLGMERSFALLGMGYAVAVLVLPPRERLPAAGLPRALALGLCALAVLTLAAFPFGIMDRLYVRAPLLRFGAATVLEVREGTTETAVLLEHRLHGRPHSLRLVTNGFSMTAASWNARRYMGLYADLPLALHERPRSALLICYGIGVTARALVDSPELERVDVVDVASEVVALAEREATDGRNPLRDPRVRVHIEDGRSYLALAREKYDLITAEPPPPTNAGIVSLYTREHFDLVRSRLAPGGFATYWLPVHTLEDTAAAAVVAAFCGAFPDCTLWSGADLDWMLVGTNGRSAPAGAQRVRSLWSQAARGVALRDVGLESPERMASLFLADSAGLRRIVSGVAPLVDDRPSRIGRVATTVPTAFAYRVLFGEDAAQAFATSPDVARLWPAELRERALPEFALQQIEHRLLIARLAGRPPEEAWLHEAYATSTSRLPVILWFASDPDLQRIAAQAEAAGEREPWVFQQRAIAALAERQPRLAAERAREAAAADPRSQFLLAYALWLEGRAAESRELLARLTAHERAFLGGLPATSAR